MCRIKYNTLGIKTLYTIFYIFCIFCQCAGLSRLPGEGTPNYLTDYDHWEKIPGNQGLSEPRYILAHVIKRVTPNAKIVAQLRNPVKR